MNSKGSASDSAALNGGSGDFPPSPIDQILEEDVDRAFGDTDDMVSEILADPQYDGRRVSRLTSQLASVGLAVMQQQQQPLQEKPSQSSPPPLPEKDEAVLQLMMNGNGSNKQELYINEIVASTIKELVAIVLETSKSLAELLIMESRRLATAAVLERIGQLSTAVVTACSQTEEELGALESQNIPQNLSNALDDARQALSRSCSCFEISIKNLTGFFAPPDASKNVLKDIVGLEKACKLMSSTVDDLVHYQAKAAAKAQKKRSAGGGALLLNGSGGCGSHALPPPSPPTTPLEPKINDFKKMVIPNIVFIKSI
jgi:ribosome-binding ATPase YchF (GTP1/OBG family)